MYHVFLYLLYLYNNKATLSPLWPLDGGGPPALAGSVQLSTTHDRVHLAAELRNIKLILYYTKLP